MSRALNLARRPFVNARPVVRTAVLLWLLGGGLLVANASLFWGYRASAAGKQAELELIRDRSAAEERKIAALATDLERARLPQLAQQVQFLNLRIAERTFAWGRLFDRLAEVLPWDVRIASLSPVSVLPVPVRAKGQAADMLVARDRFQLKIAGAAQSDEALLRFVDALFKHPAFQAPNLHREDRRDGVSFELSVTYLPGADPVTAPRSPSGATASPVPEAPQ